MEYDLSKDNEIYICNNHFQKLLTDKKTIKLEVVRKKRTTAQNRALHLWFTLIAQELNNIGMTFEYRGIKQLELNVPYTLEIVKDFIYKPIIKSMYKLDSTTKLTSQQINEVFDVVNLALAKYDIHLPFPSIESLIDYEELH